MDSADDPIGLTGAESTLFITLYARVVEGKKHNPIIFDPKGEEILRSVDYDAATMQRIPRWTLITLAMRARYLDDAVSRFIERHPDALVVHLACGLDSRYERIRSKPRAWYDIDLPDVIALRRRFYQEREGYTMISRSALDPAWMEEIAERGPTIIIAEGLMMYLPESDVRDLIARLHERFPGAELYFDAFSVWTRRRIERHPAMARTGVRIHWAIDDPKEIERWVPGVTLVEEWPFTASKEIAKLGIMWRLLFRLVGLFRATRIAHRILHFRL